MPGWQHVASRQPREHQNDCSADRPRGPADWYATAMPLPGTKPTCPRQRGLALTEEMPLPVAGRPPEPSDEPDPLPHS